MIWFQEITHIKTKIKYQRTTTRYFKYVKIEKYLLKTICFYAVELLCIFATMLTKTHFCQRKQRNCVRIKTTSDDLK